MTGLYFYDNQVLDIAAALRPSAARRAGNHRRQPRLSRARRLCVELLGRGFAWLDTGTETSLLQAGEFVRTIEERQGLKIACLEEIAFAKGFITAEDLEKLARGYNNNYGQYLLGLLPPRGDRPCQTRETRTGKLAMALGLAAAAALGVWLGHGWLLGGLAGRW